MRLSNIPVYQFKNDPPTRTDPRTPLLIASSGVVGWVSCIPVFRFDFSPERLLRASKVINVIIMFGIHSKAFHQTHTLVMNKRVVG
jgi:hypothetical protein